MTNQVKRILSMGVGVQTVAEMVRNYPLYDYIVFSDTGDEKPETYDYLQRYVLPFVKSHNIKFIIVKNQKYISLYDYCFVHKQVPMRNFRWCTDKFKRQPINKFIKSLGATKENPTYKAMGISADEVERINNEKSQDKEPKYVKLIFPLIDDNLTREDCKKIILGAGLPVPVKSGCWYCPFARKEEWRRLKIDRPEYFKLAVDLEKNNDKYPERTIKFTKPLEKVNFDYSLEDLIEESCDSGHCMA